MGEQNPGLQQAHQALGYLLALAIHPSQRVQLDLEVRLFLQVQEDQVILGHLQYLDLLSHLGLQLSLVDQGFL
jgi:hypothetical protein